MSVESLPQWALTKVATNVVKGTISRLNKKQLYFQLFVLTGETAPTPIVEGVIPEAAVEIFESNNQEPIGNSEPIDVYLFSYDPDVNISDPGKVRVDA